jgi:hypothetical protein
MDDPNKNEMSSKGGMARAQSLSKERRSEIARAAVQARWRKEGRLHELPEATHGSPDHPLRIGEIEIPCYVLGDGRRVLHQRGMVTALGMARGSSGGTGGDRLAKFTAGDRLKPFVSDNLTRVTDDPIRFRLPGGQEAYGYEATVLADICEAVLAARRAGVLQKQQEHIAEQCEILVRGFARVGIIALVDEATGYQADRARNALAKILEAYVAKELQKWVRTFEVDYYEQLFRLWKQPFDRANPTVKRPPFFGKLTNDIVYSRLAPGVLDELKRQNPADDQGRRKSKHFQFLTQTFGHPKLREHLAAVTALMKASPDKESFRKMLNVALPPQVKLPLFDDQSDDADAT